MISEESKTNNKGGRPKKINLREINKGIRFSHPEYGTVEQKATKPVLKYIPTSGMALLKGKS